MLDPSLVRTMRFDIRPFRGDDLASLLVFNSSPEARRFMGGVVSKSDTVESLRAHMQSVETMGLGARAVVERSSGSVLGYCGIQRFAGTDEFELFYGYLPTTWGRGVATEAAYALIRVARRCEAITHLVAVVHPENLASLRVLEKLQFEQSGTYLHPRWHIEHLQFKLGTGPAAV